MIVPLFVWLPLAMAMVFLAQVFLTQSIFVMLAAYILLFLLSTFRLIRSPVRRRIRAMLSERFNGEAWLSHVRDKLAWLAVVILIFPIFLALTLELSKHAVLTFNDAQYSDTDLGDIASFTVTVVTRTFIGFLLFSAGAFAHSCLCMKPEGGTATPRQLLFFVYLIAAVFILLSGEGWVFERMHLMSAKISGKELTDPVSATLHAALLSIVVLVAIYCYYKIFIALLGNLVAKDKKWQFRRSMFDKDLQENKSVIEEKQEMRKLVVAVVVCLIIGIIAFLQVYLVVQNPN